MQVTHPAKPGLYGEIKPPGTAGWYGDDLEMLTTDPPEPGMVVVEWFSLSDPKQPSDFVWEQSQLLVSRNT